jgi:hypothetical protein
MASGGRHGGGHCRGYPFAISKSRQSKPPIKPSSPQRGSAGGVEVAGEPLFHLLQKQKPPKYYYFGGFNLFFNVSQSLHTRVVNLQKNFIPLHFISFCRKNKIRRHSNISADFATLRLLVAF